MKNCTHINSPKGYQLAISGAPATTVEPLEKPATVALLPTAIPFIKPRLKVKEGERVKIGSVLIEDKRNPDVRFLSPGGGTVDAIRFGPRRAIEAIIIKLDTTEERIDFPPCDSAQLDHLDRPLLVRALLDGGVWPLLRELPWRDYPQPDSIPPAIVVTLGSDEPFQPDPAIYLTGHEEDFAFGLHILRRLTDGPVHVAARANSAVTQLLAGTVNLTWSGLYPAGDPGTLLYRLKEDASENRCWYIAGHDLLLIAALLRTGHYPIDRLVSVAGSGVAHPGHLRTRLGAPLADLAVTTSTESASLRWIQGGLLTGTRSEPQSHLGLYATALNLLPEGDSKGELFGLFLPGYRKPSYSRAFLSALHRQPLSTDCNKHGGERACIACGYCSRVCAVDILPHFTYKALHADAVEEALEHGLLDCVECGLCSYVCPAKIELVQTFKTAKRDYLKEQGQR
ncbi:MAG: 4Fe-4S dicluster domain-containing protein [Desulfuromonadaceae bacterium]|nr:4Fe-4S dicluster domain-containing protein [Desulfuromonadaceae bacterium]